MRTCKSGEYIGSVFLRVVVVVGKLYRGTESYREKLVPAPIQLLFEISEFL